MPITTALYAGLLAVGVAFPAGSLRAKLNISVGDCGNHNLICAMRRHANFVEWVPITLIMIALLELNGVSNRVIHLLGGVLVLSRIAHAIGLKPDNIKSVPRFVGATGTVLVLLVSSVWLILLFIRHPA